MLIRCLIRHCQIWQKILDTFNCKQNVCIVWRWCIYVISDKYSEQLQKYYIDTMYAYLFKAKILQKGYLEQSCSSLVMDKAEISKFSPTKNWFIWSWPWEICIRLHPCIVSVPRQQTKTSILRAWRQKTVLLQTLSKTGLITLLVIKKVQ